MTAKRNDWHNALVVGGTFLGVLMVMGLAVGVFPGLRELGIRPRTGWGLVGVFFGPLLHANAAHLMANAIPCFVLLVLLFSDRHYRPSASLAIIWALAGLGTWLIGRGGAVHIGASSLIYGMVAYLVAAGWLRRSWRAAAVALLVLALYGGLVYGVLPQRGPVSWEGHLCGAIAGVLAARWREQRMR
ncbi:MAG: rhomboid family intramembrane serine protease [Verrucomicrobia bacterium]|nr:rhomboid family intramembrane serine protease [Verrucomicrobiota bacterium]